MKRLFLSISKGEELRFLGHLDMLRTMERAVIRSGIPIAFSEGFNPHMKIAFDAALGVGVTASVFGNEIGKRFFTRKSFCTTYPATAQRGHAS